MPHKDPEAAKLYFREYRRKWAAANPEKARAASKRWFDKNREKVNEYQRNWRSKRTEGYLLSTARRRAKKRGIKFTITLKDIVIPALCPVLGVPLERSGPLWGDNTPTLDRRDSTMGYVPGNVFVISRRANVLKSDATPAELLKLYWYALGAR